MKKALGKKIDHKGFSFIHDLSPCVEFNKLITYKSWNEVISPLPGDHPVGDRSTAMTLAESTEPIHLGVFLKEEIPTFDDHAQASPG